LDDLRPFCYKIGEMPIFLSQRTFDSLEQRFQYIFSQENRYPGAPSVQPNIIDKTPFSLLGLNTTPIQVMHGNLPILGYRIQNIAYLTEVKTVTIEEKEKLRN
jgi:phosphoribosyl 1,2-cyclic phosphate phosphodiesterase